MSDETAADQLPKMLTLPEVAKALRCSKRSLYDSGWPQRLGAVKVGNKWLVRADAVVEVLNGKRPAGRGDTVHESEGSERSEHPERHTADAAQLRPAVDRQAIERLCEEGERLLAHGGSQQALVMWDSRTNGLHHRITHPELRKRLRRLRSGVSRAMRESFLAEYRESKARARTSPQRD